MRLETEYPQENYGIIGQYGQKKALESYAWSIGHKVQGLTHLLENATVEDEIARRKRERQMIDARRPLITISSST